MNSVHTSDESASVAVTAIAILTPLADSLSGLSEALNAGRVSIEDEPGADRSASCLRDFDARKYASIRGMRVYARNTQLQICVAQLALNEAGVIGVIEPGEFGLVSASTFSHMETLLEYDRSLVTVGALRTNPTLMPLALPSAPGALTALSFDAKAFALSLSDGGGSGLAALGLAARLLAGGRGRACLVTAAFTACAELSTSAARAGMLASAGGFRVLDRDSRGTAFGELAVALVLETRASARARGKRALGFIDAEASTFAAEPSLLSHALARACRSALLQTKLAPSEIALASLGANGLPHHDAAEAHALLEVLGDARARALVTAPKANLGEALDASGLMQVALALEALRTRTAPAIVGLREPAVPGLSYLTRKSELAGTRALVTSVAPSGSCSALMISVES